MSDGAEISPSGYGVLFGAFVAAICFGFASDSFLVGLGVFFGLLAIESTALNGHMSRLNEETRKQTLLFEEIRDLLKESVDSKEPL